MVNKQVISWYDWLVRHVPEPIRIPMSAACKRMKGKVMSLFGQELTVEQVQSRRIAGNTVAHFEIRNQVNTSPTDVFENANDLLIQFFREHLKTKIQFGLVCEVIRVNPTTGEVIDEEQAVFQSRQESIFPATDLDETYNRMVARY